MRSALLVINASLSPARVRRLQRARHVLAQHGFALEERVLTEGSELRPTVGRLASRHDLVLVAGGDGTVNSVAAGLLDLPQRPPLAILPLGTANDIARQWGLDSLADALAIAGTGVPAGLDVIELQPEADGRSAYALNFAAFGFAPALLQVTSPDLKRWLGRRLCYWVGFVLALRRYQAPLLDVRSPALTWTGRAFHVGAGNLEAAGGGQMRLSPGASPADGRMEICVVEALPTARVLRYLRHLIRGTHPSLPQVRYVRDTEVLIRCERPLPLAVDGEVWSSGSVRCQVRPGALAVLRAAPG
jgi:YegS/Rv2252/BmrU family lipid kinase